MKRQSLNRAGLTRRSMLQTVGFNFYDVFVYAFCILFALICVYPMWYVLICSITPYEEYIKGGLMLWPTGGVDLQYYQAIFNTKAFTTSMWISVSKTVLATVLSLLVTSTMAYACSKVHIRGMKLVNALVVFNLFFTGGLIPQYIRFHDLRHPYVKPTTKKFLSFFKFAMAISLRAFLCFALLLGTKEGPQFVPFIR